MASFGEVEIKVNHVQHTAGAVEVWEPEQQRVDYGRLSRLLADLVNLSKAQGFEVHSTEMLQSFQPKHGHLPELHVVLVQLPLDAVFNKRKHVEGQGQRPEDRSDEWYSNAGEREP